MSDSRCPVPVDSPEPPGPRPRPEPDPVPRPSPFPPAPAPAPNPNPVPRPEPPSEPVPQIRAPGRRARKRWLRSYGLLAGSLIALSTGAIAQELPCASDALGETWCAKDERGSAVVDTLGRVVCAPGMCVEHDGEWTCSSVSGGSAGLSREGPVCDGRCQRPAMEECEAVLPIGDAFGDGDVARSG